MISLWTATVYRMSPRRNWDSPTPSLASECAPPPEPKGWVHSPAGEGLGESQFRRQEKKLSTLPTLWTHLTNQGPGRRRRPERSCPRWPALYCCPLVLLWTRIWATWTRPGKAWSCHSSLQPGNAGWPCCCSRTERATCSYVDLKYHCI
jgi:hypothetical protein